MHRLPSLKELEVRHREPRDVMPLGQHKELEKLTIEYQNYRGEFLLEDPLPKLQYIYSKSCNVFLIAPQSKCPLIKELYLVEYVNIIIIKY